MADYMLVVYRGRSARRSQRWRWRLVHANGRKIAQSSEGYANREVCAVQARIVAGHLAEVECA